MPIHKFLEFDDLMLEGDVHALLEKMDLVSNHIKQHIPDEILYQGNGEPNFRTHWGAVLFHVTMARASLRAFV